MQRATICSPWLRQAQKNQIKFEAHFMNLVRIPAKGLDHQDGNGYEASIGLLLRTRQ